MDPVEGPRTVLICGPDRLLILETGGGKGQCLGPKPKGSKATWQDRDSRAAVIETRYQTPRH